MSCVGYREIVLEVAADAAGRCRIAEALAHVANCPVCQAVFRGFDRIVDPPIAAVDSSSIPRGGWEAFDSRMAEVGRRLGGEPRSRWGQVITSIAAVMVIAATGFWVGQHSTSGRQASNASAAGVTPLEASEVVHYTRKFARISRGFDGRASWMLVSDSALTGNCKNVGISRESLSADRVVDVLRLTILRGQAVVSRLDVVIVPGQSADMTTELPDKKYVHYHLGTVAVDDARLNLRAEIEAAPGTVIDGKIHGTILGTGDTEDSAITALSTTLDLKPNLQVNAGELQTASGRYEIWSALSQTTLPAQ